MEDNTIKTKVSIDNFEYRLFIGQYLEKKAENVTEIPPLHAKQNVFIKIKDKDYYIVLTGLKFTRKVYEPGLIEAEVTIRPNGGNVDLPTFSDVNDLFVRRQAELTLVDITKATTAGNDYEETIAKHYYVYMINPQIAANNGNMEMYVKLTIYSYDKLMAVDKYCKAFTAKKLASGILPKECADFGIPSEMVQADVKNLQHLKYKNSNSEDVEIIQPYLVQYNESFYDFLVRTTNRCGEFLYFEDGKLILGLPKSEAEMIGSFTSVTMEGYTPATIDVEDFSRDSAKDNGKIEGTLNYDAIEKDKAGYPKDTFLKKPQYNTPLGGDEYIFPLENDKYNNLNRELCIRANEQWKTMLLRTVDGVVKSEDCNVINLAAKTLGKFTSDTATASWFLMQNDAKAKKDVEKVFSPNSEHYNGERLVAFSSLDENGWIGRNFYATIRHQEEELHRKMICIDMGTVYIPVRLGEQIKVKGLQGSYIVVQVNLIANLMWQRNYRKFDPADQTTDLYSDRQSQVIYAIPVGHPKDDKGVENIAVNLILPPVAPVPMIRKSGPQTAFVVDNDDKKYQGRVRIAYPWQSYTDNSREKLFAAQESLRKLTADYDAQSKKQKQIEAAISLLVNDIKDWMDKLSKMSKEDLEKKYKELQHDVDYHKGEMDRLDTELAALPPDPILNKPDVDTEIGFDEFTKITQARKENRNDYEMHKKEWEKEKLILDYLDKSDRDPLEAKGKLSADVQELIGKEKTLNEEMKKMEDEVDKQKKEVEEKADDWTKVLSSTATPWVRVAQPMATNGGGAFFKPNKGDEVLVNFDNDNVEHPYVVGSVYSKNTLAPGENLDKQVKNYLQKRASIALMSPNGQHITFTAPSDGWKFVQGFSPTLKTVQAYFPTNIKDLKFDLLKGDEKDLNGGIYMGDRFGMYELSLSSHDRKIKINSPFGNVEIGAFTGITINAPNGDIKIKGKNISIEAGNKLTLHSGQNVKDKKQSIISTTVKDVATTIGGELLSPISGALNYVDFNVLRCTLEVFLRPIDGTLCLKSNNYVMLEAGRGKAQVPLIRYTDTYREALLKEEGAIKRAVYSKITAFILRIDGKVTRFQKDYMSLKRNAFKKKAVYDKVLKAIWKANQEPDVRKQSFAHRSLNDYKATTADLSTGTLAAEIEKFKIDNLKDKPADGFKVPNHTPIKSFIKLRSEYIRPIVDDYGMAVVELGKKPPQINTMFDEYTVKAVNQSLYGVDSDEETKWIDDMFKDIYGTANNLLTEELNKWNQRYVNGNEPKAAFLGEKDLNSEDDPFYDLTIVKRKMIALFLAKVSGHAKNQIEGAAPGVAAEPGKYLKTEFTAAEVNDDLVTKRWDEIAEIGDYKKKGFFGELGSLLNETFVKKVEKDQKSIDSLVNAREVWDAQSGQIIFSSSPGTTYAFKGEEIEAFDVTKQNKNKDALKKTLGII